MKRVGGKPVKATSPHLKAEPGDRALSAPAPEAPRRAGIPWLSAGVHAVADRVAALRPRGAGLLGTLALFLATGIYGVVAGDHVPSITAAIHDGADTAARAAGFGLAAVAITGRNHLSEEEVRRAAGIGPGTSVLFFDAAAARESLLAIPWIADAKVRKLYPDRVDIDIVEREVLALWQVNHQVTVIAADGTEIAPAAAAPRGDLPLVVGAGANRRARDIIDLLAKHPGIAAQTAAAVLVAERRWNLRLKNGIDVRLPEHDPAAALDQLAALDRDKKLMSRDVLAIDLRLADRVTVRLSAEAAKARDDAAKARKRKGADT